MGKRPTSKQNDRQPKSDFLRFPGWSERLPHPMTAKKLVGAMLVRLLAVVLTILGLGISAQADNARATEAEAKMAAGEELSSRGQFQEAIVRWQEAERAFARAKDIDG